MLFISFEKCVVFKHETQVLNRQKEYFRELLTAENHEPKANVENADTVAIVAEMIKNKVQEHKDVGRCGCLEPESKSELGDIYLHGLCFALFVSVIPQLLCTVRRGVGPGARGAQTYEVLLNCASYSKNKKILRHSVLDLQKNSCL